MFSICRELQAAKEFSYQGSIVYSVTVSLKSLEMTTLLFIRARYLINSWELLTKKMKE